jgi:hypothetical protein
MSIYVARRRPVLALPLTGGVGQCTTLVRPKVLADAGLDEWAASLPEGDAGLLDMSAGTAVRWVEGEGALYPKLSPGKCGLAKTSFALIDHLRSIDRRRIRRAIGPGRTFRQAVWQRVRGGPGGRAIHRDFLTQGERAWQVKANRF